MKKLLQLIFILSSFIAYSQPDGTDWRIENAVRVIKDTYGDVVRIKPKTLLKFGKNDNLSTTSETVWLTGGNEILPDGNDITKLSSSSAADTLVDVTVEGHTKHGSTIYFRTQSKRLNGQSAVELDTPLYRITRIAVTGTKGLAGTAYAYRDGTTLSGGVPQQSDSIHATVLAINNQTKKAATKLSSFDYWIVLTAKVSVGVSSNQARYVDFEIQIRADDSEAWRSIDGFSTSNTAGIRVIPYYPALIIPKGYDIRITATSSGAGTSVTASLNGALATTK